MEMQMFNQSARESTKQTKHKEETETAPIAAA
jgi:hypothetical protein